MEWLTTGVDYVYMYGKLRKTDSFIKCANKDKMVLTAHVDVNLQSVHAPHITRAELCLKPGNDTDPEFKTTYWLTKRQLHTPVHVYCFRI